VTIRPRDPRVARVRRAGQRMAPGGRRWSESPIPRPGKQRVRLTVDPEPPFTGTLPTEGSGTYRSDGGPTNFYAWNTLTPPVGTMILSVAACSYRAYEGTIGDITVPSGWRTLATGTQGPGDSAVLVKYAVACIDSMDQTEGREWLISGSKLVPQVFSWWVTGASGMTWQDPIVSVDTSLAVTLDSGNWVCSGDVNWTAPDPSWLLNCQMMQPAGFANAAESPASPGGKTAEFSTLVSPYSGSWNLTQDPQTEAVLHEGGPTPNWSVTPYTPISDVIRFAFGAK
jgi:hypothetical protein